MKQKKARYVMQAIQSWNFLVKDIIAHIKRSDCPRFLHEHHVREIAGLLHRHWYIETGRVWYKLQYSVLRPVRSQSEIKID